MIVGKIENTLERGFVKHRPNCLLIADPKHMKQQSVRMISFHVRLDIFACDI